MLSAAGLASHCQSGRFPGAVLATALAFTFAASIGAAADGQPTSARFTVDLHVAGIEPDEATTLLAARPEHRVTLKETRPTSQSPQRLRGPLVSEHRLVIIAWDSNGAEISRQYVHDPTVVRIETILYRPDGVSEIRYLPSAELRFVLPDPSHVQSIEIFRQRWDGEAFSRESLGKIELR